MENTAVPSNLLVRMAPRPLLAALTRIGILRAVAIPQAAPGLALAAPAINLKDLLRLTPAVEVYLILGCYLAIITLAEWLTAAVNPKIGVPFHAATLVLILLHASLTQTNALRHFLWAMSLSPLIRVLSLSLPLAGYPFILWYFIISVPLLAAAFVVIRTIGLNRKDLLLEMNNLPIQFIIMLPGPLLGVFEYLILQPRALAPSLALTDLLGPALVLLVSTGFSEELIFRGLLQRTTQELIPRWRAAVYINLVFAVLHAGYLSFVDILFVFVVGMCFSWFSIRTQSLLGVTIAHGLVNIFLFLIVPHVGLTLGPAR